MKYAWIAEHRDAFPIAVMCAVRNVAPAGFYDSGGRAPSPRQERHALVQQAVRRVPAESHGTSGRRQIAHPLAQRADSESACRNPLADTLREWGLASHVVPTFKPTTTPADPAQQPAENNRNQDFRAEAPHRKGGVDITYLATTAGGVDRAVVIDLFSRQVVGWSPGTSLATELASEALRRAIESRRPNGHQLRHHSDRGGQDTSDAYQHTLRALGMDCSMSRTGCGYDNAVVERFFWSLKHEGTNHSSFANLEEAVRQPGRSAPERVQIHRDLRQHCPPAPDLGIPLPQPIRSRPRPGQCGVISLPLESVMPGPSQYGDSDQGRL